MKANREAAAEFMRAAYLAMAGKFDKAEMAANLARSAMHPYLCDNCDGWCDYEECEEWPNA